MKHRKPRPKNKDKSKDKAKRNPHNTPRPQTRSQNKSRGGSQFPRPDLYGLHAVREAWLNPQRQIQNLYVTEAGLKTFEDAIAQAQRQDLKRPEPEILDKTTLENLLPSGAVHQGLALHCNALEDRDAQDLIITTQNRARSVIVMLDQVTDPHNVGAILRSASAFGAAGVVMQRRHAPELNGVLAKTACGAVDHIPVAYETNLSRALETFQEAGFTVIGLDERGHSMLEEWSDDFKTRPDHVVLVLGAEGPGMRALVREHCDLLVRLPTHEPIASLNVSNAAAVALYELTQD